MTPDSAHPETPTRSFAIGLVCGFLIGVGLAAEVYTDEPVESAQPPYPPVPTAEDLA